MEDLAQVVQWPVSVLSEEPILVAVFQMHSPMWVILEALLAKGFSLSGVQHSHIPCLKADHVRADA